MGPRLVLGSIVVALLAGGHAQAQNAPQLFPPEGAIKLSEIVAKVEKRDQFRYVSEIEWNEDGYYDVIYHTADKAKVEIKIDPKTGQAR